MPAALGECHLRVGLLSTRIRWLGAWMQTTSYIAWLNARSVRPKLSRCSKTWTISYSWLGGGWRSRGRPHTQTEKQVHGSDQRQRHSSRDRCSVDAGRDAGSVRGTQVRLAGQVGPRPSSPEEGHFCPRLFLACAQLS